MIDKNIYLDYSATTMPDDKVIERFNEVAKNYYANPNSNHFKGKESNNLIKNAEEIISKYFGVSTEELIFTSGASESNNMALKGLEYESGRSKIITTPLEHSSIVGPLGYLQKQGVIIEFLELNSDGTVSIEDLKKKLDDDVVLVSVCAVDSETGTREPIEEIGEILKNHKTLFHVDLTQAVGKVSVNLQNVDMASFSGHKIYSFKGIGGLIKKEGINITPLIHGGKSTTIFRSGTPQTELIVSLGEAFNIISEKFNEKFEYVKSLNERIKKHLEKYDKVVVNSTNKSIPHILNVSFIGKNANDTQKFFEENNILISTKTACASNMDMSKTVYSLTKSEERAKSSVRFSLSYRTTIEEVDQLLKVIDKYMVEVCK